MDSYKASQKLLKASSLMPGPVGLASKGIAKKLAQKMKELDKRKLATGNPFGRKLIKD